MEQGFIDILLKLITEQGKEVLLNASRCKAFLADYTRGEYKKECRLLLQALEAGVQKAIDTTNELDICKKQQIRVLQEEHFVIEEAAVDIIDTLAFVLRNEKPEPPKKSCKNCGKEMQDEWIICPYCGTSTAPKAETKKPAPAKPAVKKPAAPVKTADVKFRDLFEAYSQMKLPFDNGYIISSFFSETSLYSIYEIVFYAKVKEIFPTDTGLQFTAGGKKFYVLVEPDTYQLKFQEPVERSRSQGERIPKRFSDLDLIIAKNQTKIYIAKEPDETRGSFTILKPQGQNFAVVFYKLPDVYTSLASFFEMSLNRQRKVPQADAKKAAQQISTTIEKTMGF